MLVWTAMYQITLKKRGGTKQGVFSPSSDEFRQAPGINLGSVVPPSHPFPTPASKSFSESFPSPIFSPAQLQKLLKQVQLHGDNKGVADWPRTELFGSRCKVSFGGREAALWDVAMSSGRSAGLGCHSWDAECKPCTEALGAGCSLCSKTTPEELLHRACTGSGWHTGIWHHHTPCNCNMSFCLTASVLLLHTYMQP